MEFSSAEAMSDTFKGLAHSLTAVDESSKNIDPSLDAVMHAKHKRNQLHLKKRLPVR